MSRQTERNPCQFCTAETGRSEGCHSNCPRYNAFRARMDEANQKKEHDRVADGVLITGKRWSVRRVSHSKPARTRCWA